MHARDATHGAALVHGVVAIGAGKGGVASALSSFKDDNLFPFARIAALHSTLVAQSKQSAPLGHSSQLP